MSYELPITIEINNEEVDIAVEVSFIAGEPMTYWEPGCDDEIEIVDIAEDDFPVDIPYNELWDAINEVEEECYEDLLEQVKDMIVADIEDAKCWGEGY